MSRPDRSSEPLVSVVTPFHNTARYLAECIDSVLAQSYTNFEYVLMNNASTDGSREIAEGYARKDPRIKLFDTDALLDQLANYNGALARISPRSSYCKIALADDVLFPDCLARTVEVAERDPRIGLVCAYWLSGDIVRGRGLPEGVWWVPGREACRKMLLQGHFFLGTPTTVLYRSDIVRARAQFFATGHYHADTEVGYEILLKHDLGFAHEVLSFVRPDSGSITGTRLRYNPDLLDYLIVIERYGATLLTAEELRAAKAWVWREFYGYIGRSALRRRERELWEYQRRGLATVGLELRQRDILLAAVGEGVRAFLDPLSTARHISRLRAETSQRSAARPPSTLR